VPTCLTGRPLNLSGPFSSFSFLFFFFLFWFSLLAALALSPKRKEKWGLWNFYFLCCDFVRFVLGIGFLFLFLFFFSFLVEKIYMVGTRQNVKKKPSYFTF